MSFRNLESAVLAEVREVTGKRSIRLKDIIEWSMGNCSPADDSEVAVWCPRLKVTAVLLATVLGKKVSE